MKSQNSDIRIWVELSDETFVFDDIKPVKAHKRKSLKLKKEKTKKENVANPTYSEMDQFKDDLIILEIDESKSEIVTIREVIKALQL